MGSMRCAILLMMWFCVSFSGPLLTKALTNKNYYIDTRAAIRQDSSLTSEREPITGADQTGNYLDYLKNEKVGILVNQSSIMGNAREVPALPLIPLKIFSFCLIRYFPYFSAAAVHFSKPKNRHESPDRLYHSRYISKQA